MEKRLFKMTALFMAVTIAGLLILLPYRLYERDTAMARRYAQLLSDELASMIKMTMLTTKEVLRLNPDLSLSVVRDKITDLYANFAKSQDMTFRVVRSPVVERQFTVVKGRSADNDMVRAVLASGTPRSAVSGAQLTYWSPITADARCGECHKTEAKKPVKPGTVMGVVEARFDLTRERNQAFRTIAEITGFLLIMIFLTAGFFLGLVRQQLFQPLRTLTEALRRKAKDPDHQLPQFASPEMAELTDAIEANCGTATKEKK